MYNVLECRLVNFEYKSVIALAPNFRKLYNVLLIITGSTH
jgi:hypothetical protein